MKPLTTSEATVGVIGAVAGASVAKTIGDDTAKKAAKAHLDILVATRRAQHR